MPSDKDGRTSSSFTPLPFEGIVPFAKLADAGISDEMTAALMLHSRPTAGVSDQGECPEAYLIELTE